MVFTTEKFFEVGISLKKAGLSGIWTHNHWMPFRPSNRLSYQTMSSTRTQSLLFIATPIASFVPCQISFQLLPLSVAMFILIKIFFK